MHRFKGLVQDHALRVRGVLSCWGDALCERHTPGARDWRGTPWHGNTRRGASAGLRRERGAAPWWGTLICRGEVKLIYLKHTPGGQAA